MAIKTLRILATAIAIVATAGLFFWLPGHIWAQAVDPASGSHATITDSLRAELNTAQSDVSFLVLLDAQLDPNAIVTAAGADDALARRRAIYTALTAHARQTQAPLRAWLDAQGVEYTPHYLVNMIEVRGDGALAEAIARRPEVGRLVRNPTVAGLDVVEAAMPFWYTRATLPARAATGALPWGLTDVGANAASVWAMGFRGQGVVVAGQDTGVTWEHPALKTAYRGWDSSAMTVTHVYNWFDAWGRDPINDSECSPDPQIPCDDDLSFYHGTHTIGTVLGDATSMGDTVIGMAPEAEWIACRNMRDGFGTPEKYTACFEFFLAPYPQGGDPMTDGKPELAPNVINNSWGCPANEGCDSDSLRQIVETMRAAGIYVVASAGNAGPGCSSVEVPIGMHDAVTSVGAYSQDGVIAGFSSRGPVTADGSGRLKPDLSAPGVGVRSAGWIGSQPQINSYLSGTSMASPHVAGAVALLWSLDPQLIGNIDATEQILLDSSEPVITDECTGTAQSPNPVYGHGRLDMAAAVQTALNSRNAIGYSVNPVRSGSIIGGGAVAPGSVVTMTAVARPGYKFVRWTENGSEVAVSATYVFTSTGNRILVADFELNPYMITAVSGGGGTVSGGGAVAPGAIVTVTATADANYAFINWTENGVEVSTSPTYSFTATASRTLTANFFVLSERRWLPFISKQ